MRRRPLQVERRIIGASDAQFRFSNGPDGDGTFEGYLSIHGVTDSYGTRMMPGCWTAGGLDLEATYPLLDMHDTSSSVRSVLGGFKAQEDERGLRITGQYAATTAGQDARTIAGLGFASDLSVGFEKLRSLADDPMALTSCRLVEGSQIIKGFASTPGAALTAVRTAEHRSFPPVAGSHEHLSWQLEKAASEWADGEYDFGDDVDWYLHVDATFDDRVVVCVTTYSPDTVRDYWSLQYAVSETGIELGDAARVEIVATVKPASDATARLRAITKLRLGA